MNDNRKKALEEQLAQLHEEKAQRLAELKRQHDLNLKDLEIEHQRQYSELLKRRLNERHAAWEKKRR